MRGDRHPSIDASSIDTDQFARPSTVYDAAMSMESGWDRDQKEVIAFLSRPEAYGLPRGTLVERIETHCSVVFLAGDRAYKLKRSIAFGALDYRRPETRRDACQAELALNRRTAPSLYLDVLAVVHGALGELRLGGRGMALDWVVVMLRFDQDDLFDRMAARGRLTPSLMVATGETVAQFHLHAETVFDHGGHGGMTEALAANHRELQRVSPLLGAEAIARLWSTSSAALAKLGWQLESRREIGKVRRVHGDLRLANICLHGGRPTLFDCIEFSDEISCIDTLYDLAFLLVDLKMAGLASLAGVTLQSYLSVTGDGRAYEVLPLFLSVRAAGRSHALAEKSRRATDPDEGAAWQQAAAAHLQAAIAFLRNVQ